MFEQFELHERLLKVLAELNFVEPTPVQQQALPLALQGKDLRVIAQTGSGKTAAFLLPTLHQLLAIDTQREPAIRVLILLPTRELARQILEEVQRFARYTFLQAGILTGGENFKEQAAMLRKDPDILIATPGRLLEHLNAGSLQLADIQTLILDEADRMLDMGFAEDIQRVVAEAPATRQTLLFSATTGGNALREMIQLVLNQPQHLMINQVAELNETTVQQIITADSEGHKEQLVQWLLANEPYRKAMVFTNTRAQADRLYGRLVAQEFKTYILHGEKTQEERKAAIERFSQGTSRVLVATDVAARGLDIEGVDLVINFDMPRSGDEYVHRIGRTGRAGEAGLAISLITHFDWNLMSSIQRYLKQNFQQRVIKGLKASYQGPKKVKASGKAAGVKKKKTTASSKTKNSVAKKRKAPNTSGPKTVVSDDGFAPLRKKL
ncbi:DEAD/DEAH box helicase [Thiopseudomonas alkaliphila]|uniref:DEAD/DEAH box helicase n=1 Tax=Thiopseudomonas alkaliphila TaxID=1697053 RepID=UPI0025785A4C|nr:DEAD/DEAH box helicase [Thiopseudomonas alkaliphila]MDM1707883.1 DEAD/DEAH box helicase [Thiopseudomonas alkaliphila]